MKKTFFFFILISILPLQAGFAAEIDSVTTRKVKLDNSITIINGIINQRIQEGVKNANEYQEYIEEIDVFVEEENFCDV